MTFTIRLEQADGTPVDPPTIQSTVTNWRTGDTIPIGRDRTLRVVGIVVSNDEELVKARPMNRRSPSRPTSEHQRATQVEGGATWLNGRSGFLLSI